MTTILFNAYACSPNRGSELGLGWNWCINLAKYCKVYVITEGEFRDDIEKELEDFEYQDNLVFNYLPVSNEIRQMCWNQGDWRFYWHYAKWQKRALQLGIELVSKHSIDLVHQFNMIGFREPGYLWKIPHVKYVWGPFDAKEGFPIPFLEGATFLQQSKVRLKNWITYLQLRYSYRVGQAVRRADLLLGASSESVRSIEKFYGKKVYLFNETGCSPVKKPDMPAKYQKSSKFRLLWVGKFDQRKQLLLALQVMKQLTSQDFELVIIGGSEEEETLYQTKAKQLGVNDVCRWLGKLPHTEVQNWMRSSDLFLFTSVSEGTPHVVLESVANGLPVLCFDCCGHGDVINDSIGFKIPVTNPVIAIRDFAEKIIYIQRNVELRSNKAKMCFEYAQVYSWENKAKEMLAFYQNLLLAT